ncbi:hypothetical protein SNE40_021759 [Patella caerulea]|uniref:Uncharacterized protein n=1 Tax=Patella caerulea TaxID=87958 RepID=A0AAN8IX54_PATCE
MLTFRSSYIGHNYKVTKQVFLKKLATVFDPLVFFLAPYVVKGKVILQELWSSGSDWDIQLDDEHAKNYLAWIDDLTNLSDVKVPRCLQTTYETVISFQFTYLLMLLKKLIG